MPALDIMASKKEQLAILVPYLEKSANDEKIEGLPITSRTLVLVSRYLYGWHDLYIHKKGKVPVLTPEGAFLYYRGIIEGAT